LSRAANGTSLFPPGDGAGTFSCSPLSSILLLPTNLRFSPLSCSKKSLPTSACSSAAAVSVLLLLRCGHWHPSLPGISRTSICHWCCHLGIPSQQVLALFSLLVSLSRWPQLSFHPYCLGSYLLNGASLLFSMGACWALVAGFPPLCTCCLVHC
jgi:hypothetical protein